MEWYCNTEVAEFARIQMACRSPAEFLRIQLQTCSCARFPFLERFPAIGSRIKVGGMGKYDVWVLPYWSLVAFSCELPENVRCKFPQPTCNSLQNGLGLFDSENESQLY